MDFTKCDIYCSHKSHPFIYKLSSDEKKYLKKLIKYICYDKKSIDDDKIKLLKLKHLENLKINLDLFFSENPTKHYFLKTNKISPKDAYYMIDQDEENLDIILDALHVGKEIDRIGDYCIDILLKSDRLYCELNFSEPEENIYVILLDFIKINHNTETRVYIKSKEIIGISQYYTDLTNVYENLNLKIANTIIFINNLQYDIDDCVIDIHFIENTPSVIEFNQFTHGTDPCLFTWEELDIKPYEFRYKIKNDENEKIVKIIFN
jgi:hypothetical protein